MAVSLPTPCDVAFSQCEGFCTHVDLTIPTADTMDIIYVLIDNEQGNVKKTKTVANPRGKNHVLIFCLKTIQEALELPGFFSPPPQKVR